MLTVFINDETVQLNHSITVDKLLSQQGQGEKMLAVAINGEFVPRAQYMQTSISHNDKIDIVTAVGGG